VVVFVNVFFRAEHVDESNICEQTTSNVSQAVGADERTERTSRVGAVFLSVQIFLVHCSSFFLVVYVISLAVMVAYNRRMGRVSQKLEWGMLMQVAPTRFSKNTSQNSPKHAVSSEKLIIFFWEEA